VLDITSSNPGTSGDLRALSVPAGINVTAIVQVTVNNSGAGVAPYTIISSPSATDEAPAAGNSSMDRSTNTDGEVSSNVMYVYTDTSRQIRSRLSASDGSVTLYIRTLGWVDSRGRAA
jgi:hypothetical protein